MVHHIYTLVGGPGNTRACDVFQLKDVSHLRDQIDRGRVRAIESAYFNRILGNSQTDTMFVVQIVALLGDLQNLPWKNWHAIVGTPIITDGDPSTWERAETSMLLPTGTTMVVAWIAPIENVFNNNSGVEFDGHYSDAVFFTVVLTGDLNCDERFDGADIDPFFQCLVGAGCP